MMFISIWISLARSPYCLLLWSPPVADGVLLSPVCGVDDMTLDALVSLAVEEVSVRSAVETGLPAW